MKPFLLRRKPLLSKARFAFSTSQHVKAPSLPVEPYFALSDSISRIKARFQEQSDLAQFCQATIKTGGRIVGRRRASRELLFLDVQSDG